MNQLFAIILLVSGLSFVNVVAFAQSEELLTEEVNTSVQTQANAKSATKIKKFYGSALIGVAAYPEVKNVNRGYNVSVGAGYYLSEHLMLDLGLGLAKSQLSAANLLFPNQRDTFDINQYQAHLMAKYRFEGFMDSDFRPVAGVTLSYTLRKYSLTNNTLLISGNTGSSTAFDAGVNAGIDYDLNPSFTIGAEIRYMFNLSNQVSANYINPGYGYYGTPLENLQYYVAGMAARMSF